MEKGCCCCYPEEKLFLGFKLNIHDPGLEETEDNCVNNLTEDNCVNNK